MLLLQRQIADVVNDPSNECKVLNTHWDAALQSALADMDLNATSSDFQLELVAENPNPNWSYAYKYPASSVRFRRIKSCLDIDSRSSRLPYKIQLFGSPAQRCILANEGQAVAEIIGSDVPLTSLNASAGLAIAARLAVLARTLVVGKGAEKLKRELENAYAMHKAEAQRIDAEESMTFEPDFVSSEFVAERMR